MISFKKVALTTVALVVLGGCASIAPDGGRGEVSQLAAGRTAGASVTLSARDDAATRSAVAELLKAPVTAESAVRIALLNNPGLHASLATLGISDADYKKAGAVVEKNRKKLFAAGDVVLRLRKPETKDLGLLKKNAIHISFLDPFNEKKLITDMAKKNVSAISMEMIPRSTRAQKMDALSSQASLAG